MINCQNNFHQAIDKLDVSMIKKSLDLMNVLSTFIAKQNKNLIVSNNIELDYEQMKDIFLENIRQVMDEFLNPKFLVIDYRTKAFEADFDKYFENLDSKYKFLNGVSKLLQSHFPDNNFTENENKCMNTLYTKINELAVLAEACLDKILTSKSSKDDLNEFYSNYYNVKTSEKKIKNFAETKNNKIDNSLIKKIIEKIDNLADSIDNMDISAASYVFIQIKTFSNKFYVFKNSIDEKLDEIMNSYISKNGGFELIGKIGVFLKQDSNGSMILTEHKSFEAHNRSLFNRKTLSQDIDYVLKDLTGDAIDQSKLKECYEIFKEEFDSCISNYLKPNIDFAKFKCNLKLMTSNIRIDQSKPEWDETILEKLPVLIAHIFALWTLLNSGQYFQLKADKKKFLFLPHPAQIVSIFRMLGLGYEVTIYRKLKEKVGISHKDLSLKKNLVQIGTGEGKSVTLAVTAVVLSLLGYDVYCVCYSDYLSKRDYNAFKQLFDKLDLNNYIHYGTFNKICEKEINKDGDIRKSVNDLILYGKLNEKNEQIKKNTRPRVILIDEVDVFFSKDFYGNYYRPSLDLRDKTITDLIHFIWKERNNGKLTHV